MESLTKWDLGSLKTYYSVEPYEKLEEEFLDIRLLPCLQAELWKAQSRIKELEAQNIESEQTTRCSLVDYLKKKLTKEKKKSERLKFENSKLKKKISDMESSRNTMEKVCEELVTRIEELKANTKKIWDGMEEEKEMLLMVEMWREERVRVKLMEAKLALEEKYEEMNWFVAELEKCLEMVRESEVVEVVVLRRCEGLIKTVRSIEIEDNDKMDYVKFEFLSDDDDSICVLESNL